MVWNSLENKVADEFASLDSDGKLKFMKQKETKRVYTGAANLIWDKMSADPILPFIDDKHLYGQFAYDKQGKFYSQTTIRSALYIREMEKYFPLKEIKWVTDFGPGYGGFARIWCELYKDTSTYQLIDLPRLHQISQYYLKQYDVPAQWATLDEHQEPDDKSLFIATHSLNEVDLDVRIKVEKILPKYDYIYIVYNRMIDQINNMLYFEQLGDKLKETHHIYMYFEKSTSKWRLVATCRKL